MWPCGVCGRDSGRDSGWPLEDHAVAATPWNTPGLASGAQVLHDSATVAEYGLRRLATLTQLPLEPEPEPEPGAPHAFPPTRVPIDS